MKNKQYGRHNYIARKKHFLAMAIVVLLIVCLVGGLGLAKVIPIFQTNKTASIVSGPVTKGKGSQLKKSDNSGTGNTSKSTDTSQSNTQNSGSPVDLLTPTGDFVSDHHPNLSGSPASNTMSSVCTTTPGATCTIDFTNTNTGVTKHLEPETTDSNGSAYWYWTLRSVGLTEGSWQIQAIATLNGQTATATDAMALVVSQ